MVMLAQSTSASNGAIAYSMTVELPSVAYCLGMDAAKRRPLPAAGMIRWYRMGRESYRAAVWVRTSGRVGSAVRGRFGTTW